MRDSQISTKNALQTAGTLAAALKNALELVPIFGKLKENGGNMQFSTLGQRIKRLIQEEFGPERARTCEIIEPSDTAFPIEMRVEQRKMLISWQELEGGTAAARGKIRKLFAS